MEFAGCWLSFLCLIFEDFQGLMVSFGVNCNVINHLRRDYRQQRSLLQPFCHVFDEFVNFLSAFDCEVFVVCQLSEPGLDEVAKDKVQDGSKDIVDLLVACHAFGSFVSMLALLVPDFMFIVI